MRILVSTVVLYVHIIEHGTYRDGEAPVWTLRND